MNQELRIIVENLCTELSRVLRDADNEFAEFEERYSNGGYTPVLDNATAMLDVALSSAIYRIYAEKHALYTASRIWDTGDEN